MISEYYSPIHVNDFSPSDKFQRFDYIKNLTLNCRVVHFTFSSSEMHMHFIWKIPIDEGCNSEILEKSATKFAIT